MNLENPIQFKINKTVNNVDISYSNLMEISQGGPEIGNLTIDGNFFNKYRFGGPCLLDNNYLYVPVYIKKFFKTGFKLSRIDINTHDIVFIGKVMGLIYLDKIKDNKIYFFENMDKTKISTFDL